MVEYGTVHLLFLAASAVFISGGMLLASRLSRRGQNILFFAAAVGCAGLIFFTCGMGLTLKGGINWLGLARQMLQVCQFNMILVFLMLVPRFELARQYSVYFSMFAAFTTFVSVPDSYQGLEWYDLSLVTFWLFHLLAIALPLWMVAARRLKPQKRYALPVAACVFGYFTMVYMISEVLMRRGLMTVETSHSFIYKSGDTFPLKQLFDLIKIPYVYLLPLIPLMIVFFFALSWAFRNYKTGKF